MSAQKQADVQVTKDKDDKDPFHKKIQQAKSSLGEKKR
jgi:hypothetical protein